MLENIIIISLAVALTVFVIIFLLLMRKNKEELAVLMQEKVKFETFFQDSSKENQELEKKLKQLNQTLMQTEQDYELRCTAATEEIQALNSKLLSLNHQFEKLEEENYKVIGDKKVAEEKVTALTNEVNELKGKLSEKEDELISVSDELNEVRSQFNNVSNMLVKPDIKEIKKPVLYKQISGEHEQRVNGQINTVKYLIEEVLDKEFMFDTEKQYFHTSTIEISNNFAFIRASRINGEEIVYFSFAEELFEELEKYNLILRLDVKGKFDSHSTTLERNTEHIEDQSISLKISDKLCSKEEYEIYRFNLGYDDLQYVENSNIYIKFRKMNILEQYKVFETVKNKESTEEKFEAITEIISTGVLEKHLETVEISLEFKQ